MAYNDSIVIQQTSSARGDYGEAGPGAWTTYKTVWAEIEDISGNENFSSDMKVYEDIKSFKIHTHDAPSVTTKMRVSYDSRMFLITSLNKDGRLRTTIMAIAYDDE